MIKQGVADTHGYGIVKLMANQLYSLVRRRFVNHIIQMSDRGQHHHYTISNQSHPSDYSLHLVIHFVTTFLIHTTEIFNKLFLQIRGKRKGIITLPYKFLMQMTEFISQQFEHGILGLRNVACGKHISYTSFEVDNIETKATHQSVLCIRYQSSYLFRSSSQSD